jgi:mRNA interferase HigB
VRVVAVSTLRSFWSRPGRADAREPLRSWYAVAAVATWNSPAEVKAQFGSASILAHNRVVFNIAGNKYRLIVAIAYRVQVVYVKFIGTHAEYDKVDAATVDMTE